MRVLMTSWAGRSHYFPLVPLGWALRAAGHDVRVATSPGFVPVVAGSGLPAVAVGHDVDVTALLQANGANATSSADGVRTGRWPTAGAHRPADELHARARRGFAHFVRLAEVMLDDTLGYARAWRPDVVVFEPTTFAGPLVAAALGVPAVRHLWGPDFTAQLGDIGDMLLAPLLDRLGLPTANVQGDLTLDPCPEPLQVSSPLARHRVRYVPYNGPATVSPWLLEPPERPRICLTWGSAMAEHGVLPPGVEDLLAAAARQDVDVVVATDGPGPRGPGVRTAAVPLHLLLPTCAAVVHQGGAGTLMTAMAAGVPQLVLPQVWDQRFNARQLAGTGAGVTVAADRPPAADLDAGLTAVLTGQAVRAAAAGLQAANARTSPPALAVEVLAGLASPVARRAPLAAGR